MAKTSSAIALLLFVFVIVSCVSYTVVQAQGGEKHCTRDIDCQLKCPKGGYCNFNIGVCYCLPPVGKGFGEARARLSSIECHTPPDCAVVCGADCKNTTCINGICSCQCSA
ncbi:hypothetical protein PTKIN_Ptkin17bG0138700 [Pterospermum kingtungense]